MKPAALLLLVPAGFALITAAAETAAQAAAGAPSVISERLKREILARLPAYAPPPPAPAAAAPPPSPPDPDVLVLPTIVVREKPQPRLNPSDLLTTKALYQKLARDYQNSLEGLDAVLNGFFIPLISPSMAARGRAIYKARKLEQLDRTIESIGLVDPKTSAELKKAMSEMRKADDWQNRPAGG